MMNEKHICAGNIRHVKARGNEHIGSEVKLKGVPFTELCKSINFCIQFMWQKGNTFLAIVTPIVYLL